METKQRYLVHFMFSVSLKSTSNSLQNFKSLRVRVPDVRGRGWLKPPLSTRCGYQTSQSAILAALQRYVNVSNKRMVGFFVHCDKFDDLQKRQNKCTFKMKFLNPDFSKVHKCLKDLSPNR